MLKARASNRNLGQNGMETAQCTMTSCTVHAGIVYMYMYTSLEAHVWYGMGSGVIEGSVRQVEWMLQDEKH